MKGKEIFGKIKNIFNILITIFVVMFLLMVCLQRFSNNELSLFNFRIFTVVSGSMVPKYEIGDVLISKTTKPEKIKVGDAITYKGKEGSFTGKVITHEVININKDVDGKFVFTTKGKANLVEDPPVYESQVYGKVIYKPVILSFIYKIVGTKFGLFLFIVLPLFYIIGSEMLTFMLDKEEARREKMTTEIKEKTTEEEKQKEEEKEPVKKDTEKKVSKTKKEEKDK